MRHIGERLRWVRDALELTQEEIAQKVGDLHQTSWSKYEKGERSPDQIEVLRILAKLKISREYLLGNTLQGVEPELAIRIAAKHPELVFPSDKVPRTGTGQP